MNVRDALSRAGVGAATIAAAFSSAAALAGILRQMHSNSQRGHEGCSLRDAGNQTIFRQLDAQPADAPTLPLPKIEVMPPISQRE
jgi:hypothetical protein